MLLVYVDQLTERLLYTLDFIFTDRGISFEVCNDRKQVEKSNLPVLNYSTLPISTSCHVKPSSLLFEEHIHVQQLSKGVFHEEECLTFNHVTDPIASIFYVLTRYEEYLPSKRDHHDRFSAKESIQYAFDWLTKAVCDRWAEALIQHIEKQLSVSLPPTKIPVQQLPTFDIDNTFAFKWKDGLRGFIGKWRDKVKKDSIRMEARKTYELTGNDPYDAFETIQQIGKSRPSIVFWLVGEYAKFDKNISIHDVRHQALIRSISTTSEIGLHPSYASNERFDLLQNEKSSLSAILDKEVTKSRQHFLKITYPYTFQTLIKEGFKEDYSLGFHDAVGFRCGTARKHRFFNLKTNQPTSLLLQPHVYMDVTFNHYLKISTEEAKHHIKNLHEEVKRFGGTFCYIWHNETITNFDSWNGWKEVLDFTLSLDDAIQN